MSAEAAPAWDSGYSGGNFMTFLVSVICIAGWR